MKSQTASISLSALLTRTSGEVLITVLMLNLLEMIQFPSLNNQHTQKFCMDTHGEPHQYKRGLDVTDLL